MMDTKKQLFNETLWKDCVSQIFLAVLFLQVDALKKKTPVVLPTAFETRSEALKHIVKNEYSYSLQEEYITNSADHFAFEKSQNDILWRTAFIRSPALHDPDMPEWSI